ncbi:hypothetical protein A5731_16045 [Mycolicibacterium conceptionense]|uniref:Uncharacterized protein n=3 Tax=Mycolicibacterium TaxID=1866885 RepID=A0A0J8UFF7_9MYCO|nr:MULTISPECIES: hypothetical protein [Mycolicibacterium]KLI06703.1 hypothetical protein AA982_17985 [Mycolicibacterium senegalense]KLO53700.1 hypothetical protein ABW05_21570 [Mycolicibacterium senegalense]KMV19986.1 hypothetical protein ACT17_04540 [Mycolicibacterium conceptionense]MCW1821881.1 hypothetical protein [Mycolicibacterium senegalense]OBB06103.1 hypothetical protein A5718_20535 [Mycolicibacterium conceptionense]
MNAVTTSVLDFEVYLLVTMKYGMLNRKAVLEAKLAEHGLSFGDAERTHRRIAELLANEPTQFESLRALIGAETQSNEVLRFSGILWPDFDFTAEPSSTGAIQSAGYQRARGRVVVADSPTEQPPWSMDAADFGRHFGPVTVGHQSSLFDDTLPAHEGHQFDWRGKQYGAGFSWGLFLFASLMWT